MEPRMRGDDRLWCSRRGASLSKVRVDVRTQLVGVGGIESLGDGRFSDVSQNEIPDNWRRSLSALRYFNNSNNITTGVVARIL